MTYNLNFTGYWPIALTAVAAYPGLYCIFANTSPTTAHLLYIGETDHIERRIDSHDQKRVWEMEANRCPLYFTPCAFPNSADREQAEAALINRLQPPCNVYYRTGFPFPITTINSKGPVSILDTQFTVHPR